MERIKYYIKRYTPTVLVYIALFALYKYVTDKALVNPFMFPDTGSIGSAFAQNTDTMITNTTSSFQLLIPSVLISIAIALSVGLLFGLNKKIRDTFYPILYTISVIPSILLSPFALLMAPSFRTASMFLVVYQTIWSMLFATITGVMTIDKRYLDKARTLEIRGFKKLTKVLLPAASPSILSGFINSIRSAFVVLVYAEMYGTKFGLGYFVKYNADLGIYSKTWAGFIYMVIVLVVLMQIFEKIKNYMLKWTISE